MVRVLGHELVNITNIAIYEFRDALEREPWRDMHPERPNCYAGAMAGWIKYGGGLFTSTSRGGMRAIVLEGASISGQGAGRGSLGVYEEVYE